MAILRLSRGESAGGGEGKEPEARAPDSEESEDESESSYSVGGPESGVDLLWDADEKTLVAPMNALERHLRLVAEAEKPAAVVPRPAVRRHEEAQSGSRVQSGSIERQPVADPEDASTQFDDEVDRALDRFSGDEDAFDGSAGPGLPVGADGDRLSDQRLVADQRIEDVGGRVASEGIEVASGEQEPPPWPPTGYPSSPPQLPQLPPVTMMPGSHATGWPGGVPPGYPHAGYLGVRHGTAPPSTVTGQFPSVTGSYPSVTGSYPNVTGSYSTPSGQFPSYTGPIPYIVQPVVAGPAGLRWFLALSVALIVTTAVGIGLGWFLFARPGRDADDARAGAGAPDRAAATAASPVEVPAATASAAPAATASSATTPPAATPPGSATTAPVAPAATTPPASAATTQAAPAATTPTSPATTSPAAASAATTSPAAEAPASQAAEPVVAEIMSLAHPRLTTVSAPMRGEIASSSIRAARRVRKGDKLFQIRRKRPGRGDQAELAARVAELERLAKEDPVYEEFLARARADAAKAKRGGEISTAVRASVDGLVEPKVGRGARVRQGDPLAVISNPAVWTVKATLRGAEPTREWSCAITPAAGGSRAACRIEGVTTTSAGATISASVEASQVRWLRRADQKPRLLLEPPPAR
jgi:hypothetical protein